MKQMTLGAETCKCRESRVDHERGWFVLLDWRSLLGGWFVAYRRAEIYIQITLNNGYSLGIITVL